MKKAVKRQRDENAADDAAESGDNRSRYSANPQSYESGAVNGEGAGRHLGDSDNVGKFLIGEPLVQFNNLFLNQGQGRIAAADAESADLQKAD